MVRALVVPRTMESSTSTTRRPCNGGRNGVQLDAHGASPAGLLVGPWMKVAADVFVFNKAARRKGCRSAGHSPAPRPGPNPARTDDDVGLHRVLLRQKRAGSRGAPRAHGCAVDDGIQRAMYTYSNTHMACAARCRSGCGWCGRPVSSATTISPGRHSRARTRGARGGACAQDSRWQ